MYLVIVKNELAKETEQENILKLISSKILNYELSNEDYNGLSNKEIMDKLNNEQSNTLIISPEDRLLAFRDAFSLADIYFYNNGVLKRIDLCSKLKLHPFSLPYREKVKGNISFPA